MASRHNSSSVSPSRRGGGGGAGFGAGAGALGGSSLGGSLTPLNGLLNGFFPATRRSVPRDSGSESNRRFRAAHRRLQCEREAHLRVLRTLQGDAIAEQFGAHPRAVNSRGGDPLWRDGGAEHDPAPVRSRRPPAAPPPRPEREGPLEAHVRSP